MNIKNRIQNIKTYFNNSPKRIGLAILGIHIFFLLFVMGFLLRRFGDFVELAGFIVVTFPVLLIAQLQNIIPSISDSILVFPFSFLYYSLFIILLGLARNTNTKKFKVSFLTFNIWFLSNLLYGLFVLFVVHYHGDF